MAIFVFRKMKWPVNNTIEHQTKSQVKGKVEELLMNKKCCRKGISLSVVQGSITEREFVFLWHLAYIRITSIKKCHRKRSFCSVTILATKGNVTEREYLFLWHLAYIGMTSIRKCHRKRTSCSVTLFVHRHSLHINCTICTILVKSLKISGKTRQGMLYGVT